MKCYRGTIRSQSQCLSRARSTPGSPQELLLCKVGSIKGLEFRDDKCKVTDPVGTWARTGTQGSRGIFTRKDASLCLKFREEASLHLAPPRDRSPGRLVEGPRKGFSHCAQRSLRSSQWFLRAFVGRRNGEAEGTSELTVPPASKPTRESPFPCFIY